MIVEKYANINLNFSDSFSNNIIPPVYNALGRLKIFEEIDYI